MTKCSDCGEEILDYPSFETDFGILCRKCFAKRVGKEIEIHPIYSPRTKAEGHNKSED